MKIGNVYTLTTEVCSAFNKVTAMKLCMVTGPRSAVVSASDCGSEGLGFESHQSHVGFFGPGRLLPRAGSAMGPVGRLEPHSRASSTSRMHL